jgi:hypothetical protein
LFVATILIHRTMINLSFESFSMEWVYLYCIRVIVCLLFA